MPRKRYIFKVSERVVLAADYFSELKSAPHDAMQQLALTLVYFTGGDWSGDAVLKATRDAAGILRHCGMSLRRVELVRVGAPEKYRYLDTPVSRELARKRQLGKATVFFVPDTRHRPAFDAEAIGRGNSKSRPELADTVWVARATRNLEVVLAHELVHVLMDSGEHLELPGNLMREQTTPENTRLTDAQCARLRDVGAKNGLLRAVGN